MSKTFNIVTTVNRTTPWSFSALTLDVMVPFGLEPDHDEVCAHLPQPREFEAAPDAVRGVGSTGNEVVGLHVIALHPVVTGIVNC